MSDNIENIQNEILFVGAIYKEPSLLVEYASQIRSKYDFADEATRFFFDNATVIYTTRTQTFDRTTVSTFMTEEQERYSQFQKYGGYNLLQKWIELAIVKDIKTYAEILKKYSLLREYSNKGFDVSKIIAHPKFEVLKANDIYRIVKSKVDKIQTVILGNNEVEILNENISSTVNSCLESPDMGIVTPYSSWNEMFRGIKTECLMALGMRSNDGKSRFMFKLIAYIALVRKQKVCVMLNEMSIKDMRFCLLVTVINNKEFEKLHNVRITKKEREITLGLYKDSNGDFLTRKYSKDGDCSETFDDYVNRVNTYSDEYRNVMKVSKWIEEETQGLILAVDMVSDYSDRAIELEIKKQQMTQGVKYFFYDTLKDTTTTVGDWTGLKITTTRLSELTRELNIFIYCSIQLTDETNFVKPHELTSSNIANCKQLKHVLDALLLFKAVDYKDYPKYKYLVYDADWGNFGEQKLDINKTYYIGVTDKNRFGTKKKIVYEVNLDTNEWYERGELKVG